ncbi:LamG-like jellyroll fold domain-containing protein [Sphaerisporangium sp. NPDC005289]|uniref:LamG-like jellyroll fold domain-containing protein n=1 Tax=Sphaerisporangium sp. NPDC005289 TaxID=3155247 RepID=UPI0033ABD695
MRRYRLPSRAVRAIALPAALLASLSGLTAAPHQASPAKASAEAPPPAPTERQAVEAARRSGTRVEVLSLRTETRQVFADPGGGFTSETAALPERVRRGGGWADVDTTLRFAGDGTVRPVATPLDLAFSGGGTVPLASIGEGGRSVAMSWPGGLPRPVLEAGTATYPSVLPGVDLKVTASVLGFSEVLVVKTREAAANPALARLRFATRGAGVSVRRSPAGGLSAVTEGGETVFHAPAPRMWDSSGISAEAPSVARPSASRSSGTASPEAGSSGAGSSAAGISGTKSSGTGFLGTGPRPGGRQALLGVEATPDEVVLTPDARLLTGANVTYPVYIDPQWSGSKQAWTYVDRAFPNQEYWNSSHMPEAGNYGSGIKRSFFRMDSNNVNGKHILKATFRITQAKSWGCTSSPQAVQLWLTSGISSSTTWNHQPSWSDWQDSVSSDAGYNSSCPDKGIEFDVTATIAKAAKSGWPNTTFGLKDYDDTGSSTWGWKGFGNAPKLVVDYNTPPAAPSGVGTYPATPCVTGAGRPAVNAGDAESPISLKAKIYDPDKANDGVRAEFAFHHYNTTTAVWDDVTATLPGGGKTAYKYTTAATDHSIKLSGLVTGQSYSYKVKAYDGTDSSAWSPWCEFTVDTVDPATLPKITSADYPGDTPDDWRGGVGGAGAFTFAPGDGETDVTAFRFALDDPSLATPATQVAIPAGQTSVTVPVAPRHDWLNALYVFPVDRAGNVGKIPAVHSFYVRAGADPVGLWRLDETAGTTAGDSAAAPHPVTLAGDTAWTGGRVNGAARLNGSTGYGSTAEPVVRTDRGLTVSAWVRLTAKTVNSSVLSQSGDRNSGFQLYYSSTYNRWIFGKYATDVDGTALSRAISDTEPQLGVWTHLTGVYDAPAKQVRLYVNGTLQQTAAAFPYTPWNTNGPLQVGRTKWEGGFHENFAGDVDDVRVWDRILSDDPRTVNDPMLGNEIAAMAKQPPAQLGLWRLDEGTGTTAADSSGYGRNATLAGGASWSDDGFDGAAVLHLNGTTAYASTTSAPVRTDHSFTVTARMRLTGDETCAMPVHTLTAVGQDGARNSGFYLGYRTFTENGATVYRWSFSTAGNDTDSFTMTHARSVETVGCSTLDTWTLLVGVYDEVAKELRLYVNGQLADVRPFTAWNAGGALQIGRVRNKGAYVDHFAGDVDDVHAFAGTLTDRQVLNLAMGLPLDG